MVYPLDANTKLNSLPDEVTFNDLAEAVATVLPSVAPKSLAFPPRLNDTVDAFTLGELAAYYKTASVGDLPLVDNPPSAERVNSSTDTINMDHTVATVRTILRGSSSLSALTLNTPSISEGALSGVFVSSILGTTPGSSLELLDDGGGRFALSLANTLITGLQGFDYETATTHNITIRETLVGVNNSPRDTVLAISVTNVAEVVLAALTLSANSISEAAGPASIVGNLVGVSSGSTLSLVDSAGGRFALNGAQVVTGDTLLNYATAQSHQITVRETHSDGTNSPRDTILTINVLQAIAPITLNVLTLTANTIVEGSTAGAVVGGIQNTSAGSALSLLDDAGGRFAIASGELVAGATPTNYEAATSHQITVRETLSGAVGNPKDTVLTVNVSNTLEVTLVALSLDSSTVAENAAADAIVGGVVGKASGSTLSLVDTAGSRFALSGNNVVRGATALNYETATSHQITLRETHSDANNGPRDTILTITVTNVAEVTLAALTLSGNSIPEGSAPGVTVGGVVGKTASSTLSLFDDAGGRFSLSGTTLLTGATSTNYATATSHNVTIRETHPDGTNSPRDTVLTVNVTDVSGAYDYLITDDATWTSTFALADATLAGKTIAIAPGTYSNKVITNRPASTLRIIAQDPLNPPKLQFLILDTIQNFQFEDVWYTSTAWGNSPTPCLRYVSRSANGYLSNLTHKRCSFVGNFEGVLDNPAFDPSFGTYPYYACIVPVFTAGVLTSLQVSKVTKDDGTFIDLNYVGSLVADGTGYQFIFYNQGTGGVNWNAAGAVLPTATFDVVGGYITNMVVTNGGSGATDTSNVTANGLYNTGQGTANVAWTGRASMTSMMPAAVTDDTTTGGTSASSALVKRGVLRYEDCKVRQCVNGLKHSAAEYQETVRCTAESVYQDPFAFGVVEGQKSILHLNNHVQSLFSAAGHPNDPHSDGILQIWPQLTGGVTRVSPVEVVVQGNTIIMGAWNNAQGIFLRFQYSQNPAPAVKGIISHNIIQTRVQPNAISIDPTSEMIVWRNLTMHTKTGDTDGSTKCSISLNGVPGTTLLGKNMAEGYGTTYGAGPKNSTLYPNATITSTAPFTNYTIPTSRAALLAAIELTGVGQWTNANYGPLGGSHDFNALTPQWSDIPYFVAWPVKTEQGLSSTTDSDWAVLLGPDGTFAWTSDRNMQIANDSAGTGASVGALSGNHTHSQLARKFLRTSVINSALGKTASSSSVTLAGAVRSFISVSIRQATYPSVTNGGTEYSRWATNGSLTGIAKGIFAVRRNLNTALNNGIMYGGVSTSVFRDYLITSGSEERVQMISSAIHVSRFDMGSHPVGVWFDDVFMFDWTKDPSVDGKSEVAKWVRNYVQAPLDEAFSTFNTISGTRTCTLDNLLGTTSAKGLGMFASSAGSNISNAQAEWGWFWFGQAADVMPDITDPLVTSKLSADHFGADGSASGALPTPHIFFHADTNGPTEWNAGLTNRGSLGGSLAKITAGAYA